MASIWEGVECFAECCTKPVASMWLCKMHISRDDRHNDLEPPPNRYYTPYDQFKAYSSWDAKGCRVWNATKLPSGYGQMGYKGRVNLVHRVAWVEDGRDIPKGLYLDHTCYNKSCFNLEHLRLVSRKQNAENLPKLPSNNTTGYRGVSYYARDNNYSASVVHLGRTNFLGRYPTAKEAAVVALKKRLELFTHNDEDRKLAAEWGIAA